MSGVPRELAEHSLNINPGAKPVKQALRRFGDKKRRTIGKELAKLLEAGFVREVIHTNWVANPVLVPKKNTEILRMCIDYIGLNKHCPKDPFPLPRIDQVIDSMAGSELLCFSRCIFWVPSDPDAGVGSIGDLVHHSLRYILLYYYALRLEKYRCHITTDHAVVPTRPDWSERTCLRR
jgi:hypothetical protein